jgi:hypothetical protein
MLLPLSTWMAIGLTAGVPVASPEPGASGMDVPISLAPAESAGSSPLAPSGSALAVPPAQAGLAESDSGASGSPWYGLSAGRKLGFALDLGVPQGAALEVLFKPWWWLRLNGGFAYNVIGTGIRGGLTLIPFHFAVTPTLNFDLGHYFSGDLTKFTSSSDPNEEALLHDAAYDFWSLQLGLEFGSQNGFLFFTRGGLAHIGTTLSGQDVTNYANSRPGTTGTFAVGDAHFSALIPCFSFGFSLFVL